MSATLLESLVAAIEANNPLVGPFTGGVYNTMAAPDTPLPYLVLRITDSNATGIIGSRKWIDKVTVTFEVRHTTGDAAEILADNLRTALMQMATVTWTNGLECGHWLAPGASGELEADLGVDGSDVWIQRLPIGYTITRTA